MKWDRLRLFNIVAQTRNITEASYILHVSQSALSRQMKALENELGVKLFLRNSDGISLTKAGMRLSSSVEILASDISKTHNQLLEDMDVPSGRLNITATNATISAGSNISSLELFLAVQDLNLENFNISGTAIDISANGVTNINASTNLTVTVSEITTGLVGANAPNNLVEVPQFAWVVPE